MQEEILLEYEKIKDQLSEEEFLAEIEEIRQNHEDLGFFNDIDYARMVLKNHGSVDEVLSQDDEDDSIEETNLEESYDVFVIFFYKHNTLYISNLKILSNKQLFKKASL